MFSKSNFSKTPTFFKIKKTGGFNNNTFQYRVYSQYPIGSALMLSTIKCSEQLHLNSYYVSEKVFSDRSEEIAQGISVKKSQNITLIYELLPDVFKENYKIHYTQTVPVTRFELANVYFEKKSNYKYYEGKAPISNGSYYLGSIRLGGVLGDIFVDLDAEEFNFLKKQLGQLKASALSKREIITQFTDFFRTNTLEQSNSACSRLKKTHTLSRLSGVMPLSSFIFLGYGDCRPHAIAIAALLNEAGIACDFVNYKEIMQSKNAEGNWEIAYTFDHSVVIYKEKDGIDYIADAFFSEFNQLPLSCLLEGFVNKEGSVRYQFIEQNPFPQIYVKNPLVNYNATSFSVRVLGEKGGITLRPNTEAQTITPSMHQAIKDIGTNWDLTKFARGNAPHKIGNVTNTAAFTNHQDIRVLDMPIRLRGNAKDYQIPHEVEAYQETIQAIINHAHKVVPENQIQEYNTYLTIDQTWVEKGNTQRKPGIHTDGFQGSNMFQGTTINFGYIVSNAVPTSFYTDPFYFTNFDSRVHNYNLEMDRQSHTMKPLLSEALAIYLMNAYTPHAAMEAEQSGYRTFFRLLYDKEKYNRYGNSLNRLLNYDWKMLKSNNLSLTFQYKPPCTKETRFLERLKTTELSHNIFQELTIFYQEIKTSNQDRYFNFIYRVFSLDSQPLSTYLLSIVAQDVLCHDQLIKILLIPLASVHETIRKLAEQLIYETFQYKLSIGKIDEIYGLVYEITNDPRYMVNQSQFTDLLQISCKIH